MADESGLIRNRRYIVWDAEKASVNKLLLLRITENRLVFFMLPFIPSKWLYINWQCTLLLYTALFHDFMIIILFSASSWHVNAWYDNGGSLKWLTARGLVISILYLLLLLCLFIISVYFVLLCMGFNRTLPSLSHIHLLASWKWGPWLCESGGWRSFSFNCLISENFYFRKLNRNSYSYLVTVTILTLNN
jgi:hypothetical protein